MPFFLGSNELRVYKKQTEVNKQLKVATVVSQYMFVHNKNLSRQQRR